MPSHGGRSSYKKSEKYFCTFTFNPALVDRTDFYDVSQKLSKWLQHLKERYAHDLMYVVVPELHSDGRSYHFHAVMSNVGKMQLMPQAGIGVLTSTV